MPLWVARLAAVPVEGVARLFGRPPLFTKYSLYTLSSGNRFKNAKARRELGFEPRPLEETLSDMVDERQSQQD
ncbi:hypothetical protein DCC25_10695 [Auritidibacter sp. NML120636]|nr:hypothetical protein DCC25_10695 [Auritidibacter sp. NML120636]